MASARKIPFPFVLDLLVPINIVIKPMFGCHAIYVRDKIMLILRQREDHEDANGIWIMTSHEHHASLKKEFPSLQSVYILSNGKNETGTQMIPVDADDFESSAMRICELILKGDPRIGRIPKAKKKKAVGNRQSASSGRQSASSGRQSVKTKSRVRIKLSAKKKSTVSSKRSLKKKTPVSKKKLK